jgi:cysteine synthase
MRIGRDVTELVGQTPMVRINRMVNCSDAEIWAKLEIRNFQ